MRLIVVAALLSMTACDAPNRGSRPAEPVDNAAAEKMERGTSVQPAQSVEAAPAPSPARSVPALAVEAEGLRLIDAESGRARALPFGLSEAQVAEALAFRGPPAASGLNPECGAGPMTIVRWADGLGVHHQDGRFVGWALARGPTPEGAPTTAAGVGVGSTRAELEAAYAITVETTTLGLEFHAGGLHGLLDGAGAQARVTNLWAGTDCAFR